MEISKIKIYIDTVLVLLHKEIKVRYKNSFLGYLWSVLNPLIYALTLSFVFAGIMKVKIDNFFPFIMSVIFSWQWIANSVNTSPTIFISNAGIIKKVNFPKTALVVAVICQDMIHFILSIPVVLIFLIYSGVDFKIGALLNLPFMILNQFVFIFGLSIIFSSINVFFRDIERIVMFMTNFLFYVSSVLFPVEMIPEKYKLIFQFNPVVYLMENWRNLMIKGEIVWDIYFHSLVLAVFISAIGLFIYNKVKYKFAEVL